MRGRHRDWFLGVAEEAATELFGSEQVMWLDRLDRDHENLRAALAWSRTRGQGEVGLRLSLALWWFWNVRGYLGEGREQLEGLLALPGVEARTSARALALATAGTLARFQGDYGAAEALFGESLTIDQELGNKAGIAGSTLNLGAAARAQGKYAVAQALLAESLAIFRELGDKEGIAQSLGQLGWVAHAQGDYGAAWVLFEKSLAIFQEQGAKGAIPWLLNGLGITAHAQGDYGAARALLEESLASFREQGNNRGIAPGLEGLAAVTAAQGRAECATRLFGAAEALRDAMGAALPPAERAEHDRYVAAVRTALDEKAFAAAWAAGRAMSPPAVVAYALQEQDADA